ncbi:MAG: apolipoprotein N-acyltransferase [Litoreibacter sp.]|nr:apolipoprotein N-acyltransferase [Litoreibacter sp.]
MTGALRRLFSSPTRPSLRKALPFVAAGLIAASGQAPLSLWWLGLAGFALVFYFFTRAASPGAAAWLGWCFGAGYFAGALFWIVEPFLVDVARHGWMAPFALVFLSGGLALIWATAFGLAARFSPGLRGLGLIVLWSAAEMLRAVLFTGFPWALAGYIWTDHPIVQLAALGGPHLLTFATFAIAGLPFILRPVPGGVAALGVLAAGWVYGMAALSDAPPAQTGKTVRLIQPNAAQNLKWKRDMVPVFLQRQLDLTASPAETAPDLVIWPETAIAYRLSLAEPVLREISAAAKGVPVILGANDVIDEAFHNTLAVLDEGGAVQSAYHKHHLVPFGEYIPFGDFLRQFGINGLAARDGAGYASGPGPRLINIPGIGSALPLICYEVIFPRNFRTETRPDLMIQITNDAWFGNLSGPYQHLAQARVRAVEQGLPLIRAANTGVSAVIGPQGRVLAATALNEAAVLDAPVPAALPATPYARFGDWPMRALLLVLLVLALTVRRGLRD